MSACLVDNRKRTSVISRLQMKAAKIKSATKPVHMVLAITVVSISGIVK